MKILSVGIIMSILLVSCKNERVKIHLNKVVVDSVLSEKRLTAPILKALPEITKKLRLTSLNQGTDSFEFRFWLPNRRTEVINVLTISYTQSRWVSRLVSFVPIMPQLGDDYERFKQTEIKDYKDTILEANINMNLLIDSLSILNLQQAPPNVEIEKGLEWEQAPTRYMLEFADKYNYRVIHYFEAARKPKAILFDKKFKFLKELIKRHYFIDF